MIELEREKKECTGVKIVDELAQESREENEKREKD